MNNGRFAIALHILVLLTKNQGDLLSSEYIAGSININAAMVRKALQGLKQRGFVQSKEGKHGGVSLAKNPQDITLSQIYGSIRETSILGSKQQPNPNCSVGKQINIHLDNLYQDAERALVAALEKQTLWEFAQKFK